jgi:hypothetical protein
MQGIFCRNKENVYKTFKESFVECYNHQEKKKMPTIFRLGARAIGTCLVLLAAAWQSIGKWGN